jgi:hypothetical protein
MVHVRQIVSGMYKIWQWIYGPLGAEAYADIEASKWNISFCSLVPLPSDCHREFNNYLNVAAREFENRPLDGR